MPTSRSETLFLCLWGLAFLVALGGELAGRGRHVERLGLTAIPAHLPLGGPVWDPRREPARELRLWPGIGEARALRIARARARAPALGLPWLSLWGIGPKTLEALRAAFEARGKVFPERLLPPLQVGKR